jgi:NAD(P)-dependent dehydrogenase (short-subunit alcohol dehydrogenase family)
MENLNGKVGFITGGASGIGFGIAQAMVGEGMKIMLADIEENTLRAAVAILRDLGADVDGVLCDVANVEAVQEAADKTIERFGKVHILVNNAGVGGGGKTGSIALKDWRWVVDINLMGVIYGTEIFVPLIKSHGEGGHVINTASMAGHSAVAGMAPYSATKFAVVGYTESIHLELAAHNIGATILCPGWVATRIHESRRNHPDGAGNGEPTGLSKAMAKVVNSGMSPEVFGRWAVENVKNNELYVFTHPSMRSAIDARFAAIGAAYDLCEKSNIGANDKPAG